MRRFLRRRRSGPLNGFLLLSRRLLSFVHRLLSALVPQLLRFIYSCLLPRCIFSEVDAVYSARFIFLLHSIRTGWFPTLTLLDKVGFFSGY